jgi:hypothetical protein
MGVRTFTYRNPASQLGFSQAMSGLADTGIFIAPKFADANPFEVNDWALLGILTGQANINPNVEEFEVKTGSPQTRKMSIKTAHMDSVEVEISHLTLVGYQLAYANDFMPGVTSNITFASDGQTTVTSATENMVTVVADGTNIAKGDLCLVAHSSVNSKRFDELMYVEEVNGNTIQHNMLSYLPAVNTPIKKIAGSSLTGGGIKFISGGSSFPEREFLIVRYLHPSKYLFLQHRKRGLITGTQGFNFNVSEPVKVSATIKFLELGEDDNNIIYGYDYLVPLES